MVPLIGRLVLLLEKVIRVPPMRIAVPKFLNESALAFHDTAIEALRNETLRVYKHARNIIARGLSLNRQDMLSELSIEDVINNNGKPIAFNIDAAYEKNIKSLYAAILVFSSKVPVEAQAAAEITRMRNANQNIIAALKGIKHMQQNMFEYVDSENQHIRAEYNRIRTRIIRVMRRLEKIRSANESESDVTVLSLDALKLTLKENAAMLNQRIEDLIRSRDITAEMGISLINDSNYAYDVIRNLIAVNGNLFHADAKAETEAEHKIALEDHEISSVLEEGEK